MRGAVLAAPPDLEVDTGGTAFLANSRGAGIADWGFGRSYRSEIEVWCTGGVVEAKRAFAKPPDLETEVVVKPQGGDVDVIKTGAANHFVLMLDQFVCITRGESNADLAATRNRARLMQDIRVGAASTS